MLEQVVNELLQGPVAQTFPGNGLKQIPTQQFKEAAAPITPSALLLPGTLLLKGQKLFQRLPYFCNA
jgi:hypothetical protein